jgi:hypothetical protein
MVWLVVGIILLVGFVLFPCWCCLVVAAREDKRMERWRKEHRDEQE